jgi:hypothetical protein
MKDLSWLLLELQCMGEYIPLLSGRTRLEAKMHVNQLITSIAKEAHAKWMMSRMTILDPNKELFRDTIVICLPDGSESGLDTADQVYVLPASCKGAPLRKEHVVVDWEQVIWLQLSHETLGQILLFLHPKTFQYHMVCNLYGIRAMRS